MTNDFNVQFPQYVHCTDIPLERVLSVFPSGNIYSKQKTCCQEYGTIQCHPRVQGPTKKIFLRTHHGAIPKKVYAPFYMHYQLIFFANTGNITKGYFRLKKMKRQQLVIHRRHCPLLTLMAHFWVCLRYGDPSQPVDSLLL